MLCWPERKQSCGNIILNERFGNKEFWYAIIDYETIETWNLIILIFFWISESSHVRSLFGRFFTDANDANKTVITNNIDSIQKVPRYSVAAGCLVVQIDDEVHISAVHAERTGKWLVKITEVRFRMDIIFAESSNQRRSRDESAKTDVKNNKPRTTISTVSGKSCTTLPAAHKLYTFYNNILP